jgi:pyrimidine deaminase RibD-like protein
MPSSIEKSVTLGGQCYEQTLEDIQRDPNRDGVLYLFRLKDLASRGGERLVQLFCSGPIKTSTPDFSERIELVCFNKIRRSFDSGEISFDVPYEKHIYQDHILEPSDFQEINPADDEAIKQLIIHEAYWLGFRYNQNPGKYFQAFDSPSDMEYLGVSRQDIRRILWLLQAEGLIEGTAAPGIGRPTPKLVQAYKLPQNPRNNAVMEDKRSASTVPTTGLRGEDREFAQLAIDEAAKSKPEDDGRVHPKVGAVVAKDGEILSKAHRGENPKCHAEFIALEKKLNDDLIANATVYTTLEPCTTRNHPKIPCAQRLVERRVARVFIGMLDPNRDISGKGCQHLRDAGIEIQFFPPDLMKQVEEMNREFIRDQRAKHQGAKDRTSNIDRMRQQLYREISNNYHKVVVKVAYCVSVTGFKEGAWEHFSEKLDLSFNVWNFYHDEKRKELLFELDEVEAICRIYDKFAQINGDFPGYPHVRGKEAAAEVDDRLLDGTLDIALYKQVSSADAWRFMDDMLQGKRESYRKSLNPF